MIDAAGNARGVAVIRTEDGGIAERATEVRQLLEGVGVEPSPGRSAQLFRGAMDRFWDLDLAAAQRGLAAAGPGLPRPHARGPRGARARELAVADFDLVGERRRQGLPARPRRPRVAAAARVRGRPGAPGGVGEDHSVHRRRGLTMRVGVPAEVKADEHRVALGPAGANELVQHGHEVRVEHRAGEGSDFPDAAYERVGASIGDASAAWGCDLVLKVKEPPAGRVRLPPRRPGPLHLPPPRGEPGR